MHLTIKFLILICICSSAKADKTTITTTTIPKDSNTDVKETDEKLREKRQLTYIPPNPPVYLDGPQQQNLPIIGTLVGGLPILGNSQNLLGGLSGLTSGLTGTLGNLGGLPAGLGGLTSGLTGPLGNLGGNLGNLGGLTNGLGGLTNGVTAPLGNLGGTLGNLSPLGNLGGVGGLLGGSNGANIVPTCPAGQRHSCRCEPIPKPPGSPQRNQNGDIIEIEDQSVRRNADGSIEVIAHLTNGLTIYQKSSSGLVSKEIDGYYSLKISNERYLTVYYTINDLDYTVKAEVQAEPPQTHK